ncbi:MAG: type II secretion system F family protein [Patescibacteria group bacterium]
MKLRYKAVTKDSKIVRGLVEAKDTAEAVNYLRNKELVPVSVTEDRRNDISAFIPFFGKVKKGDLVLFTRQLSSMLSSGLTLIKSLEILKEQMVGKAMYEIIDSIVSDIEEGKNFSSAIAKYPEIFSPIYVSIIRSAEASGLLDTALARMADNLEKQAKLRNTIKAALTYPAIVIALMIFVVFVMMTVVIPQLSGLYESLDVELPFTTKVVIGLSQFTVTFWPFIIVGLILGIFLFRRWHKTEPGKLIMDNLLLKIPVFGPLLKKLILTEFSRTLSLLIGSGTLVVDSLVQTSDTLGNIHYRNAVVDIAKKVENGVTIGDSISSYALFPPILVQLVKIGEQTGKLDETLMKAAEYFEDETDQAVKTLTTALEPFIMIILGLGVAFLLIAVITPIYSLISAIK